MGTRNALQFAPALLLALLVTGGLVAVRLEPVAGRPVAVMFRPGITLTTAFAQAAAARRDVLRIGEGWPMVVLVLAPDSTAKPLPQGTWLQFDIVGVTGCFTF